MTPRRFLKIAYAVLKVSVYASAHLLRVGCRPSPLAIVQAQAVVKTLLQRNPSLDTQIITIATTGESKQGAEVQNLPLAITGIDFTGALDDAILTGQIDLAVHSLKDVPPSASWNKNLHISCVLPREDPADVLVGPYESIDDLPVGAKVGTSSIRRQAQMLALRPDVEIVNIRGNLDARIQALKKGTVDALILAKAGLKRQHKELTVNYRCIPTEQMLPGVCQGIVGVVHSTSHLASAKVAESIPALLDKAINRPSTIAAAAERAFLDSMDKTAPWAGRPPMAGLMEMVHGNDDTSWVFRGVLARPDGTRVLRASASTKSHSCTEEDARVLGSQVGLELLRLAGGRFYD